MGRLLLGLRRRVHQGVKTGPGKTELTEGSWEMKLFVNGFV